MNILSKTHAWILNHANQDAHIIDMTAGNGHDTKFLAQNFKQVTAIDIQAQAIENTKKRCKAFNNVHTILKSHALVDYEKLTPIHGVMYNLGYLPHGDKSIITQTESTITSLNKVKNLVSDFIVITVYPGHEGGDTESKAVLNWIEENNFKPTIYTRHTPKSPIAYCIAL